MSEDKEMNIGNKIQELRKKNNITQEKLASEMGVSVAAVSKWENANSMPDIIMLCSLADYFSITTDELLGRKDSTLKFIIADDVDFICASIESVLLKGKHLCLAKVNNGIRLLDELKKVIPDAIFLDIHMPEMDGLTALEKIRKRYPDIKVIIVSADSSSEAKDRAIKLGSAGFITKPFLPEHIETIIKTVFQQ